jgi:hypothetical protein
MNLGLAQEDQVRLIDVDDMSEVVNVTTEPLNIPGESTER